MSKRKSVSTARLIKCASILSLATATSASWAQTVTYGVPFSATSQTLPVMITKKVTFSGCTDSSKNTTTTSTVSGTLPVFVPWQVEGGALDEAGLFGPTDVLPPRLQPSSVVVVTDGVSQSAGQSYAGPAETAITTGGILNQSSMTYNYGAAVATTKFAETFKGHQVYVNESTGINQQDYVTDYNIQSTYDVVSAKQVFTQTSVSTWDDPSYTGDNPTGCTETTTETASVTDTLTYSTAPAIQVAQLLPPATVGTPYKAQLVTGGNPSGGPYGIEADGLPPGLTSNADGSITGTPTAPASGSKTYSLVVFASEGSEVNAPAPSQITVSAPATQTCVPNKPGNLAAGDSWYQLDSSWAGLPYDNKQSVHSETGAHTTIGDRGGLLTALAYMLSSAGAPYTPATLDTVIGQHNADFSWAIPPRMVDGGSINIGTAVLDASMGYPAANSAGVQFSKSLLGSMATSDLDHALCVTSAPVLLQVNDPGSNYRHYVVATEKAGDGYHIVDPGFMGRTNLSAYGGKFRILGTLAPRATASNLELDFNIVDGATLAVYPPGLAYTGVIGNTSNAPHKTNAGTGYLTIDNAVDNDAGSIQPSSTTYMVLTDTSNYTTGNQLYTIRVSGLHLGVYYLTIKAAGGLNVVSSTPGIGNLGSNAVFLLKLDAVNKTMHLYRQGSFSATQQDITNAQKLGAYGTADAATLSGYINAAQAASGFSDAAHKQQYAAALNSFIAKAKTFHNADAVAVLGGDGASLLAGPVYP